MTPETTWWEIGGGWAMIGALSMVAAFALSLYNHMRRSRREKARERADAQARHDDQVRAAMVASQLAKAQQVDVDALKAGQRSSLDAVLRVERAVDGHGVALSAISESAASQARDFHTHIDSDRMEFGGLGRRVEIVEADLSEIKATLKGIDKRLGNFGRQPRAAK